MEKRWSPTHEKHKFPSDHYIYIGFSFSSEASAIGHMDYHPKEGEMSPKYWAFLMENTFCHTSSSTLVRRAGTEGVMGASAPLQKDSVPGRKAQSQHLGLFNVIPSCGDTTISCQAYRRQWYSLALRSIFPGTSLSAGFSGSLIFCAPNLRWNIHVFQIH